MLLICGIPSEPPVALVAEAAAAAGVPCVMLSQRAAMHADLMVELVGGELSGKLWLGEESWPLDAFGGIYNRLTDHRTLPELQCRGRTPPADSLVEHVAALHALLASWIDVAPGRVLNRSRPTATNGSKPYQLRRIGLVGFEVPPTLVTNDPEAVGAFAAQHGRVIYKSVSSVRSIVRELNSSDLGRLDRVRCLPVQFQAYVPGRNVRVHVVGQRVFATEIETPALDYRYAARDSLPVAMRPTRLPHDIEARCLALSTALELPFCGIDLKHTPEDRWFCFEVNPSPAFSYYEAETGQPIAQAVVDWLAGG